MKCNGTYWKNVVLMDELRSSYLMLCRMEVYTVGEPKYFPYHQAAEELWGLVEKLQSQLDAAGKNAFYHTDEG